MPQVSVVMPVRNAERFVREAITSLLIDWMLYDYEIWVVNDASTDGTGAILSTFEQWKTSPIRVHHYGTHEGVTDCLCLAVKLSEGKYIARQDADDVSLPGRLSIQARYLDDHPDTVLVASRVQIIDETGAIIRRGCQARWLPVAQMRLGRNPICHGSVMFRRDAYDAAGGYRGTWEHAQDMDLWLRMAELGKIKILPQELYQLREHSGRISIQKREQQAAFASLARWASVRVK